MSKCGICGVGLSDDLFSFVTGERTCSVCTVQYIGRTPVTEASITMARDLLGLKPGEYLQHDRGAEAAKILGRK